MDYKKLTFGTAGIRGIIGDKPGEINMEAIAAISHGLARVLKEKYGRGKVVFCYDSRRNGSKFAYCAAKVIGSYGFSVYVAPEPAPTPFLSYAIKSMDAVGGVNITASHNPKEYTGYKAYAKGGAQIDVAFGYEVQNSLWAMAKAEVPAFEGIEAIPSYVYDQYVDTIIENNKLLNTDFGGFRAVFTPLCGSSGQLMASLVQKASLPLTFVQEEMAPNGDFPGLPKPNPDDESVFTRSLALGDYPLFLANDPDGDRLGAMVKVPGGYRLLSGNEIGILLLYYLLETTPDLSGKYIVKSIVSTEFAQRLARAYGLRVENVPVGFRYIAQKIAVDSKNFLFGFEESGGYLAHDHAGDKDGIEAACLLLKAGAHWQGQGRDLVAVLTQLYEKYGRVDNRTLTLDMTLEDAKAAMAFLRSHPLATLGGQRIETFKDYLQETGELKANLLSITTSDYSLLLRPSGTEPKMKVYISSYVRKNNAETAVKELLAKAVAQDI